jgi:hypothetical protein
MRDLVPDGDAHLLGKFAGVPSAPLDRQPIDGDLVRKESGIAGASIREGHTVVVAEQMIVPWSVFDDDLDVVET